MLQMLQLLHVLLLQLLLLQLLLLQLLLLQLLLLLLQLLLQELLYLLLLNQLPLQGGLRPKCAAADRQAHLRVAGNQLLSFLLLLL